MNFDSLKNWIPAFKRANRAEKAVLLFALVTAVPGFFGAFSEKWFQDNLTVRILLAAISTGLLLYAAWRIWRGPVVQPPPPPPRPLKGGEKYTINDGRLFLRLGRGDELGRLWKLISDGRVSLAAVQGESGSGKSSLLEGGLRFLLSQDGIEHLDNPKPTEPIPCVYCEMQSRDPADDLLREISAALKFEPVAHASSTPANLPKAVKRLIETGKRWVILLDQFEQVSLDEPRHAPVFDFFRTLVSQSSGIRLTAIVAYRMEYASEWNRFCAGLDEQNLPAPKLLPIELFKVDGSEGRRAKDILAILGESARMKLDDVADPLIHLLANKDGKVLPFDLSLSLPCLAALGRDVPGPNDLPAGGFPAMIAKYLRSRLDLTHLRPSEREAVFATIHLKLTRNSPEGRQRVAEGLTLEELAQDVSITSSDLLAALRHLSDRETSLLEEVIPSDGPKRYRLLHERFIPALELVAGSALAGVQQARRVFHDCWGAYSPAQPFERLLRGSDLRLVHSHWDRLAELHMDESKRRYFQRSLQYRTRRRSATLALSIALISVAVFFLFRDRQIHYARDQVASLIATRRHEDLLRSPSATENLRSLAACNEHARLSALREVMRRPEFSDSFSSAEAYLAHAVIGFDPDGANTRLVLIHATGILSKSKTPESYGDVVLGLPKSLNLGKDLDCSQVAQAFVKWITDATHEKDEDALAWVSDGLAALAIGLTQDQRLAMAQQLVSRMTTTTNLNGPQIEALAIAFAPLTDDLLPDQRLPLAEALVSRMTDAAAGLDFFQIKALADVLISVNTKKLLPSQRLPLAEALVSRLTAAITDPSRYEIAELAYALEPLATCLPPTKLLAAVQALVTSMTNSTMRDPDILDRAEALALLAPKLPPEQQLAAGEALVGEVISPKNTMTTYELGKLCGTLVPLATNLPPELLFPACRKLADWLSAEINEWDTDALESLVKALPLMTAEKAPELLQPAVDTWTRRMTNVIARSRNREVEELGDFFALLTNYLSPRQVQPAIRALVNRMTDTTTNLSSDDLATLGMASRPLAANLSPVELQSAARAVANRMTDATAKLSGEDLAKLGSALGPLATSLTHKELQAVARALLRRMTETTADFNIRSLANMGLALGAVAENLNALELVPALLVLEAEMYKSQSSRSRDQLTEAWIGLERVACSKERKTLRASRIIYWLHQPHFASQRKFGEHKSESTLDAQVLLLRHLGAISGADFKDDIWKFVAWAKAPDGGVKFGIRLPNRPKWWFLKPKPDPPPSFTSSKITP